MGAMGWIGIHRTNPRAKLERFEKAMKLSPLDPFAFNTRMGMASALACSGRPEKAVTVAKDVTKKHPVVTWAHRLLASWAVMAGDIETAHSAARKLLAANPDFTIRRYPAIPGFQDMPDSATGWRKGCETLACPRDDTPETSTPKA
jgi:predicted Zn-dependent protease